MSGVRCQPKQSAAARTSSPVRLVRGSSLSFALTLALCLSPGAATADSAPAAKPAPRVEKSSFGSIEVTITADPPTVELDRDMLLTVHATAPTEITVLLPSPDDRLKGFVLNGMIDRGVQAEGGKVTVERQFLITPVVSDEHRLGPIAIPFANRTRGPSATDWFATRPIVFERASPIAGKPGSDIRTDLKPVWIYPPFKTVAGWVLVAAAAVAAAILLWKLGRKARRQIKLMRMSPRERALRELAELMAKDLIGRNLLKEFYLELTMIVRRYIERAHRIRAPEQTTEEFLAAVSLDARFSRDVVAKFRVFLEAADLVKFAAHRPKEDEIGRATGTAKDYIETDDAAKRGTT
ncbi:MAG: hypothetical protein QME60_04300 [Verrucomicrobiota bacterium]|nr:hypothetical protein [Verrucomicrobiota bacterium]